MAIVLMSLQNGSDIRGIASQGIPGEEVNLSPATAELLAKAFITWLSNKQNIPAESLQIAVGTDSRISGPSLKQSFINGCIYLGSNVYDCGLATTPAMFMSTRFNETKCNGAVMVTASHLPFNRNGFKFFTEDSGLEKQDITDIISLAEKYNFITNSVKGTVSTFNLIERYATFICDFIRNQTGKDYPLQGKKIIVDAGNGAGGFFADKILHILGADIKGSLFLEPDGLFPNHMPNPENEEAIGFLQKAVLKEKAELGVIFDTDVDRAAIVDNNGKPVNRNSLIALLSAIILKEHPQSVIVTDSVTSNELSSFIKAKNGIHLRYKRGYRNVINKSIELNNEGKESWLAIETSGHAAFKENYFLDDGAFVVAKLLVTFACLTEKNKTLSHLIKNLKEPEVSKEYRLKISDNDASGYGQHIIDLLQKFILTIKGWQVEKDNYEGIRVQCDNNSGGGWFMLRKSLHEPLLALNIETESIQGLNKILLSLSLFFKDFPLLDTKTMS